MTDLAKKQLNTILMDLQTFLILVLMCWCYSSRVSSQPEDSDFIGMVGGSFLGMTGFVRHLPLHSTPHSPNITCQRGESLWKRVASPPPSRTIFWLTYLSVAQTTYPASPPLQDPPLHSFFSGLSWKKSLQATVSAPTRMTNSVKSTSPSLLASRSFITLSTASLSWAFWGWMGRAGLWLCQWVMNDVHWCVLALAWVPHVNTLVCLWDHSPPGSCPALLWGAPSALPCSGWTCPPHSLSTCGKSGSSAALHSPGWWWALCWTCWAGVWEEQCRQYNENQMQLWTLADDPVIDDHVASKSGGVAYWAWSNPICNLLMPDHTAT